MSSYFGFLLLVHIAGAIIGFGPTFAFMILGPMAGRAQGSAGVTIMESMVAIEKKLVIPVAVVTQPLSGLLLIIESERHKNFFSHEWLWIALILYVVALYTAIFQQTPSVEKMIDMAKAGEAESSAFGKLASKTQKLGPALTLMLVAIIFLMIMKPGG